MSTSAADFQALVNATVAALNQIQAMLGAAGVKKITANADVNYTPKADSRIVRDSATLTADHKLVLLTTNITNGYKVELSRRGSSGGHTRGVYQADGTTLIASIADNASADFIYDSVAGAWFQK